jgi:5-methylcytosine-specific restriction endonuclease McrA
MTKSFIVLHERAVQISKSYLKAECDLIAILQKIDDCKGYREIGHKSLFDYATQSLGLSESVSYNLIAITRKSREVPKLQEMIRDQKVSISNARMIAPILTYQNQEKWLSAAASLPKRALEKEIAKEHPKTITQEQTRYVTENRLELKIGISERLEEKLRHAQSLASSQAGKVIDLEGTLEELVDFYLQKNDPIEKAKRIESRGAKKVNPDEPKPSNKLPTRNEQKSIVNPVPGQVKAPANPRYIPAQLRRSVLLRDQNQCSFIAPNEIRCSERKWLDIHHVRPLAEGGQTCLENLKLVCRGHHQMMHH